MSGGLIEAVDWACWIAALAAIFGYVLAFLRNRPYARPFSSLGLLLTGGGLLTLPTVFASAPDLPPGPALFVVGSLIAAVVFQLIAALRRRQRRAERPAA